jgi:RND family efflux transporter MFP subunit
MPGELEETTSRRSTLGKIFRFFLPLTLIVGSVVVVMVLVAISKAKSPERKPEGQQAILVQAIPAELRSLNFSVTSQGTVKPRTETILVPEVSGKIVTVSENFIAGGFFQAGDVLLQIDPSDYRTALKRAQANLASRKARLSEEVARSEQALKDWKNLGRKGEPSELVLRKPQLADARANVQAAEADVQKAERDLQRTSITVPYDGLVRVKRVDIGQYVTPGTQLGTTFAIDSAEIRLPLSNSDLAYLDLPSATNRNDKPLPHVTLRAEKGASTGVWEASIIRTEGVVDEASRVVYAVAEVIDPYGVLGQSTQKELKAGTFVRAEITGLRADNVIQLPRYVLRADNTVLVSNSDNELEIRPVSVVRAEPKQVYLDGGIEAGELVVTTTMDAPIPGIKLKISGADDPDAGSASPSDNNIVAVDGVE